MENVNTFPFELVIKEDDKELFIHTVENVLREDLQCETSFGCSIKNCHTHIGSKKHLNKFVEAELLFHNSYYNKGFAYLSTNLILEKIRERQNKYTGILLIGYETFSELYLCEVRELVLAAGYTNVHYCVFETVGSEERIRYDSEVDLNQELFYSFLVPINTTLTTHDKLMNFFCGINDLTEEWLKKKHFVNVALIVIAPDGEDNDYWVMDEKNRTLLLTKDKQKSLVSLGENTVYYFARTESLWVDGNKCIQCFPDLEEGKTLVDEEPVFEVNRASVVPMLQLGISTVPEPFNTEKCEKSEYNIQKVARLTGYMHSGHAIRNGNHYEYYFDTQKFFEEEKEEISNWLEKDVKSKVEDCRREVVYHFLVAPRHYSNAGFVQKVNDVVFNGAARILYFDVSKEYRDNIRAKYSDFIRLINNVEKSNQPSVFCFHYLDDMIYSGGTFNRIKSIISSLVGKNGNEGKCRSELFASIIVLVGRNSLETKKGLIGNPEYFFEYVHLSISPMRSHEDACTLCQLKNNFAKMKVVSATSQMSAECINIIDEHKRKEVDELRKKKDESKFYHSSYEERLRVIIIHLLTERMKNRIWLFRDELPVNRENKKEIYDVLSRYYNALFRLEDLLPEELREKKTEIKIAFIKAISRPFFIYHIRQRQAAFRFCLEQLDRMIKAGYSKAKTDDFKIVMALVNGLADMNACYLLRAEVLKELMKWAKLGEKKGNHFSRIRYFKVVKRLTNLSMDENKALLLESILVNGNEENFFNNGRNYENVEFEVEDWCTLYFENNKILYDGLKLKHRGVKQSGAVPYYLEKFQELLRINKISEDDKIKICNAYQKIYNVISTKEGIVNYVELSREVRALFEPYSTIMFMRDETQNDIFERYLLVGETGESRKIEVQEIMSGKGLKRIEDCLKQEIVKGTFYVEKNIVKNEKTMVIVKVSSQGIKGEDIDSLYFVFMHDERILNKKIKNYNQYEIQLLFRIKVLLTLREDFEKMIRRENFPNLYKQGHIDSVRRALSISKAGQHQTLEYYMNKKVEKELWERYREACEKGSTNSESVRLSKEMLDRNYQLLANDYISSKYRRIVTGKAIGLDKNTDDIEAVLIDFGFRRENRKLTYEMYAPVSKSDPGDKIKIIIECKENTFRNKQFVFFLDGADNVPNYYLLIILLSCNAGYHFKRKDEDDSCVVKISSKGNYLLFENYQINPQKTSKEEREKLAIEAKEAAEKKMKQPPWFQSKPENESITYWTIYQFYKEMVDKGEYAKYFDNINEPMSVQAKDGKFVLKLKVLREEKND